MNINEIMEKVKAGVSRAGSFAAKTADTAGKEATKVFNKSKHGVNILELNADVDRLYKEIGKLMYSAHKGEAENAELIEEKLCEIDAKLSEIEALRDKIDELSDVKTCVCGAKNPKDALYCQKCGTEF